jgi:hypothetical protein
MLGRSGQSRIPINSIVSSEIDALEESAFYHCNQSKKVRFIFKKEIGKGRKLYVDFKTASLLPELH